MDDADEERTVDDPLSSDHHRGLRLEEGDEIGGRKVQMPALHYLDDAEWKMELPSMAEIGIDDVFTQPRGTLAANATVVLHSMAATHLNGRYATVSEPLGPKGRVVVSFGFSGLLMSEVSVATPSEDGATDVLNLLETQARKVSVRRDKLAFVRTGLEDGCLRGRFEGLYPRWKDRSTAAEYARVIALQRGNVDSNNILYKPARRDKLTPLISCSVQDISEAPQTHRILGYLTEVDKCRLEATSYARATYADCNRIMAHFKRDHMCVSLANDDGLRKTLTDIEEKAKLRGRRKQQEREKGKKKKKKNKETTEGDNNNDERKDDDQNDDDETRKKLVRFLFIKCPTFQRIVTLFQLMDESNRNRPYEDAARGPAPGNVRFLAVASVAISAALQSSTSTTSVAEANAVTQDPVRRALVNDFPAHPKLRHPVAVVADLARAYRHFGNLTAHLLMLLLKLATPGPRYVADCDVLRKCGFYDALVDVINYHSANYGDPSLCGFALEVFCTVCYHTSGLQRESVLRVRVVLRDIARAGGRDAAHRFVKHPFAKSLGPRTAGLLTSILALPADR